MSHHQSNSIRYINRETGQIETEEVFGENAIRFLYGTSFLSRTLGHAALHLIAKWPFFAAIYGWLQNRRFSARKIAPFIKRFGIDTTEFEQTADSFGSFNDFFVRKLKPVCRPISAAPAVMPADGRYTFFPEISIDDTFEVKKRGFCLKTVLEDEALAERYHGGSLVIARLCPTDCHRFYFPCDCTPSAARKINGKLFSVNPIAIKDNPWIWGENKRFLTLLSSELFGQVAFLEVGATNVGSVIETYTPFQPQVKGGEKGYFAFGGSALLILFEKGRIQFDEDLVRASAAPAKNKMKPQNGAKDFSPGQGSPGRGNAALGRDELAGTAVRASAAPAKNKMKPQNGAKDFSSRSKGSPGRGNAALGRDELAGTAVRASKQGFEIKCLIGQSLGTVQKLHFHSSI